MIKEPYYRVDFDAVNCFLDIRVNDVPVFTWNIDGQMATSIPINSAIIKSGGQRISYNILPLLGTFSLKENTIFEASVWLCDSSGEEIEHKEEINKFTMPESNGTPLPAYKGEKIFVANVPYKLEAWQDSQDLSKVENLRQKVNLFYKGIEEMIANGQYEQFIKMIEKKEENIATCMYLSDEEKNKRNASLLNKLKEGYEIVPSSPKDIMLVYGYNKLVSLKKIDGTSALLLTHPETKINLNLPLRLHLPQGSTEFLVI